MRERIEKATAGVLAGDMIARCRGSDGGNTGKGRDDNSTPERDFPLW